MADEELAQAREFFACGFYKKAYDICTSGLSSNELVEAEKEAIAFRAKQLLGKLPATARANLQKSTVAGIKALDIYIAFCNSDNESDRRSILESLKRLALNSADPTAKALAASAFMELEEYTDALQLCDSETAEMLALRMQILLKMDRYDLAHEVVEKMSANNDEAAVTKLATASNLIINGNFQEAYLTLDDIQDLYTQRNSGSDLKDEDVSPILLNGMAVGNLLRQLWAEAIEDLLVCLNKFPNDSDTLANLVCACRNSKKYADADVYFSKLLEAAPKHFLVRKKEQLDLAFERFANSVAAQK